MLADCIGLQHRIKDEYVLLTTEQDQKTNLERKLSASLQNYYRNLVQMDGNCSRGNKMLFED